MEVINALGRRKSAVARVYVTAGKGNITINGRTLEDYFKEDTLRYIVRQPLSVTETLADFDIKVNLDGGGIKGQAEALRPSPAMPARSRGRNPDSPVHVDASSSANVSIYVELTECTVRIQNGQTPLTVTARLSCCGKFRRPAPAA